MPIDLVPRNSTAPRPSGIQRPPQGKASLAGLPRTNTASNNLRGLDARSFHLKGSREDGIGNDQSHSVEPTSPPFAFVPVERRWTKREPFLPHATARREPLNRTGYSVQSRTGRERRKQPIGEELV